MIEGSVLAGGVLERFWVRQTDVLDLSDVGFLREPDEHHLPGPPPLPLAALEAIPALVLLGEPGMGKSTALGAELARIAAKAADGGEVVLHVDLRDFSSDTLLHRRVFEAPEVASWLQGNSRLHLFLDSLDEALLRIDTVANLLTAELRRLPTKRLTIRIACRTAVWPADTLGAALASIWGADGAQTLEIAPLRRQDVRRLVGAAGIEPDDFLRALFASEAVPFAIKPLTLGLLVRIHGRHGSLPHGTRELFRQGCLLLCEEQNRSRRDARRVGSLGPAKRLRIAGRIAAATLLGNRFAIWTGPESERAEHDVCASVLAGSREAGEFGRFEPSESDVAEVLDTGLFNSRGARRLGWAHRSFADFLAAEYLLERRVPSETILRAVRHPTGGLIPQLSGVAGWVASRDSATRAALVAEEPLTLLRSDLTGWAPSDLGALVASLLDLADRQGPQVLLLSHAFARLAYPGLQIQLKPYVDGSSGRFAARHTALLVAQKCALRELGPSLVAVACDVGEHPALRAAAVAALATCGDDSTPTLLLGLLQTTADQDPDQEIRGAVLVGLWPGYIGAKELFSSLTPSNETYLGAYAAFLFRLAETLRPADLPYALAWATALLKSPGHDDRFRDLELADDIMAKAWWALEDDDEILIPLLEHLRVRLGTYGELWRSSNEKSRKRFVEALATDTPRRRRLLSAVLRRGVSPVEAATLGRAGFATHDDLAWLISVSPAGTERLDAADPGTLLELLGQVCDPHDMEDFSLLYEVAPRWAELRERYAQCFDGISLDSEYARMCRNAREQHRMFEAARPPPICTDPAGEIQATLARSEAGEVDEWCRLTFLLGLTPKSRRQNSELTYAIVEMPGWREADGSTRERLLAAAERYLRSRILRSDDWIDLRPISVSRRDLAGLQALVLLSREAQGRYRALHSAVWQDWAPAVIALPKEPPGLGQTVLDAAREAPNKVAETVGRMIRADKRRHRASSASAPDARDAHFWGLVDIPEGCWRIPQVAEAVMRELLDPASSPAEVAALLALLIAVGHEPALDQASAWALDPSCPAQLRQAAGGLLLSHAPGRTWRSLYAVLAVDDGFARGVLDRVASHRPLNEPFYLAFDEAEVGDLFLLLERLFPKEADAQAAAGYVNEVFFVRHLAEAIPVYLARRATAAAIAQLGRLSQAFPDRTWLVSELATAQRAMRGSTWTPLSVAEVLAMTDRPGSQLLTSPGDLAKALLEALAGLKAELGGAQNPVQFLWDQQPDGSFRPKSEDSLSDYVRLYLQRVLEPLGVFANREVEVDREPGKPIGRRTDILVNAVRRRDDGEAYDTLTAVIETKGCWNPGLMTSLESQLFSDYMLTLHAPVGIYLVGWFDASCWDHTDSRRRRGTAMARQDAQLKLDRQAASIPDGFEVWPVLLDCRAP